MQLFEDTSLQFPKKLVMLTEYPGFIACSYSQYAVQLSDFYSKIVNILSHIWGLRD
jgi:hypothetical protein